MAPSPLARQTGWPRLARSSHQMVIEILASAHYNGHSVCNKNAGKYEITYWNTWNKWSHKGLIKVSNKSQISLKPGTKSFPMGNRT